MDVLFNDGVTGISQVSGVRVRVPNFATASLPASARLGEIVFDTTVAKMKVWTGAGWETIKKTKKDKCLK